MVLLVIACLASGLVISTLVTAAMRSLAPRWGLIDRPNARKVHVVPTPMGGGIGIILGVVIPLGAAQTVAWWLGRSGTVPEWVPAELAPHLKSVSFRAGQLWSIVTA